MSFHMPRNQYMRHHREGLRCEEVVVWRLVARINSCSLCFSTCLRGRLLFDWEDCGDDEPDDLSLRKKLRRCIVDTRRSVVKQPRQREQSQVGNGKLDRFFSPTQNDVGDCLLLCVLHAQVSVWTLRRSEREASSLSTELYEQRPPKGSVK